MNNIKIRYLLLSIALIPIIGMMVILMVSLNQTDKINAQSTEIATNMLPSTKLLGSLNTQTSDFRLEESEMIILKDSTKTIDVYNKKLKEINEIIGKYRNFISSKQEGTLFDEFERTFKIYETESKKLITLIDEGRMEQAAKFHFTSHQKCYNDYSELLLALIDLNEKDSVAASNLGDELFNNSMIIIGLVFLGSITISIIVSFFIITRFEKSMKGISEGITSLSLGDLNNSSEVISGENELARLSKDYQGVISKLQGIVGGLFSVSEQVSSSSEELIVVMQNTAKNIQSELAQVEVISTAISELSST
ncbi:MCP four helix bundle domain-containing protein, partial [Aliivibrio salmonicida]